MQKRIAFLVLVISCFSCFSQINFEKGYFLNNAGQKVECFIKNMDWTYNPTDFEYKLSETSEIETKNIQTVKEFAILGESKYVRKVVSIDRSSSIQGRISADKNPSFQQEELYLKVMVEGEASLYGYFDGPLTRFFYTYKENEIKQLIYKKYIVKANIIGANEQYKQQLWNDLKCSEIKREDLKDVRYFRRDLIDVFVSYNECATGIYTSFQNKEKKDLFNLTIRPRVKSSSMQVNFNGFDISDIVTLGDQTSFALGVEAEYILPFNKNTWSLFLEPTYQTYKGEGETRSKVLIGFSTARTSIDYKSLDIPFGVRHYFFLSQTSKLFVNIAYTLSQDLSSEATIEREFFSQTLTDLGSGNNFSAGIGYKYGERFGIEFRYDFSRNTFNRYSSIKSDYSSASLILGYSLF